MFVEILFSSCIVETSFITLVMSFFFLFHRFEKFSSQLSLQLTWNAD
jgi:hypothetical protein